MINKCVQIYTETLNAVNRGTYTWVGRGLYRLGASRSDFGPTIRHADSPSPPSPICVVEQNYPRHTIVGTVVTIHLIINCGGMRESLTSRLLSDNDLTVELLYPICVSCVLSNKPN